MRLVLKHIIFQAELSNFCSQKVIYTVETSKFVVLCVKHVKLLC